MTEKRTTGAKAYSKWKAIEPKDKRNPVLQLQGRTEYYKAIHDSSQQLVFATKFTLPRVENDNERDRLGCLVMVHKKSLIRADDIFLAEDLGLKR
jgi:hypothetical protein